MGERGKLQFGLLYLSLHNQLVKRVGINRTLTRKEFFCILGKHFLIPKSVKPLVIKEMEARKLIIKEKNNDIKVLKCNVNLE